jgi:hypothetical protein
VCFGPAQVHTQYHLGPVLCLGTARARLDVDIRVTRVHLSGEHASKLEAGNALLEACQVLLDLGGGVGIVFFDREREQLVRVTEAVANFVETDDDLFQLRAFLAECLGPFGLIPNVGLFEFALDFRQPFRLAFIVKDTPSTLRCVR